MLRFTWNLAQGFNAVFEKQLHSEKYFQCRNLLCSISESIGIQEIIVLYASLSSKIQRAIVSVNGAHIRNREKETQHSGVLHQSQAPGWISGQQLQ